MTTVHIKDTINADIQSVWDRVTSLDNYSWRSDLESIEIIEEGKTFVEYAKGGFATTFEITKFEPLKVYEFTMFNKNIKGSWVGKFYSEEGKTIIDFTENVSTDNFVMRLFIKGYLKKIQRQYVKDLKVYLEK